MLMVDSSPAPRASQGGLTRTISELGPREAEFLARRLGVDPAVVDRDHALGVVLWALSTSGGMPGWVVPAAVRLLARIQRGMYLPPGSQASHGCQCYASRSLAIRPAHVTGEVRELGIEAGQGRRPDGG